MISLKKVIDTAKEFGVWDVQVDEGIFHSVCHQIARKGFLGGCRYDIHGESRLTVEAFTERLDGLFHTGFLTDSYIVYEGINIVCRTQSDENFDENSLTFDYPGVRLTIPNNL